MIGCAADPSRVGQPGGLLGAMMQLWVLCSSSGYLGFSHQINARNNHTVDRIFIGKNTADV